MKYSDFIKCMNVVLFSGFSFMVFQALAQATLPDGGLTDVGPGLLPGIVAAFSGGKSLIAGAGFVMLLVLGFKQFALPKLNLSTAALPYVSMFLGIIWAVIYGIYTGSPIKDSAALVLAGPLASQLWDTLGQYVISGLKKAVAGSPKV